MPGTLTIRPLSANLTRDTELFGKMDPYCKIVLGKQKVQSAVCKNGGKHPHWEDTMTLRRINEPSLQIEIKEKDWLLPDGTIGTCDINLDEIEQQARVLKWYPISFQDNNIGKILIEASYDSDHAIPRDDKKPAQQSSQPPVTLPSGPFQLNLVQRTDYDGAQKPGGFLSGLKALVWNPVTGHTLPLGAVNHPEAEAKYQQEQERQHQEYHQQHVQHQQPQEPLYAPVQDVPVQAPVQAEGVFYAPKYPSFEPSNYGNAYVDSVSNNENYVTDYRDQNYNAGQQYQSNDPLNIIRGK